MADRPSFEETLRVLGEAVADLSQRVSVIERALGAQPYDPEPLSIAAPSPTAAAALIATAPAAPDLVGLLTLAGRTLIVFGGAYLLRAITESGRVPAGAGIAMGLVYAVSWYGAADRAAGARRRLSSLFHGTAAVVISLPLVWEASTHFQFLTPDTSALAVAALTAVALGVAWHRRLPSLAAIASVAGILTSVGLAAATGHVLPFAAAVITIGIVTLWEADTLNWTWLPWPAAIAADLLLAALQARTSVVPPAEPPGAVILLCGAFLVAYGGSFALRLIARGRDAGAFEFCQMAVMLVVGLLGAASVARTHLPSIVWQLGALSATAGFAAYVLAFSVVRRRGRPRRNFYFFSTSALALVIWGSSTLAHGTLLALILIFAALAASLWASRLGEPAAPLHGAVFAIAAAIASGLASMAAMIWLAPARAWPGYSVTAWLALASSVACLVLPAHAAGAGRGRLDAIARTALATVMVVGGGTAVVLLVGPMLAGTPPHAGVLASVTTVVAACSAMVLARASRVARMAEAGWLVYPVLAFGALKLFLDDFRFSQPSTLFLALAIYGAALITVPRLLRRRS